MRNWVQNQLQKTNIKPLFRLFLIGLKGQLDNKTSKPYGYYPRVFSAVMSLCFAKWLTDFYKMEMDVKGYNWFIPDYVYRVRQQSYIYWQLSRLSKNLHTTFTYYKWGQNTMYQINRKGQQTPFLAHTAIQNTTTFNSYLHQYNFPAPPQKHALIMMYLKNMKNPYDLQNHLRYKSINLGDWLRAFYYLIYRQFGITNRWRYDQYVSKPAVYYNWQKLKLAFLISKDRQKLYNCLDQFQNSGFEWLKFFIWFS